MRESEFATSNQPRRRSIQILQLMVLNGAIRIAFVMTMAVRNVRGNCRMGKDQLTFGDMHRVLAQ